MKFEFHKTCSLVDQTDNRPQTTDHCLLRLLPVGCHVGSSRARLTCGKLELHVGDVEVAPLLEEVARAARTTLDGKPVVVEIDCRVDCIASDPLRLQQILNNLATNAAKFTDAGRITIAASLDRDTVVFAVRDSGCGIR